jgi:hypothetical protein
MEVGMKVVRVVGVVRIGRVNKVGKKVKAAQVIVRVGSRSGPGMTTVIVHGNTTRVEPRLCNAGFPLGTTGSTR